MCAALTSSLLARPQGAAGLGASAPPCVVFEQLQGAPCLLPIELVVGHLEGVSLCCKYLLLHACRRGLDGGLLHQWELLGRELLV